MNILFQDPIASLEMITLGLTACYIGRLTITHGAFGRCISLGQDSRHNLNECAQTFSAKPFSPMLWQENKGEEGRSKKLYRKLFEVGDTISVRKRSMRWQRMRTFLIAH